MVPTSFTHVGVTCRDQKVIEDFYTRHFGFTRARVVPLGEESIIFLKSGNVSLELFKAKEDRPIPAPTADGYAFSGLRHLALAVESVEAKIADMGDDTRLARLCHGRVGQGVTIGFCYRLISSRVECRSTESLK